MRYKKKSVVLWIALLGCIVYALYVIVPNRTLSVWPESTIVVVKSDEGYTFIDPNNTHSSVQLDEDWLTKSHTLLRSAIDCKLDGDRIISVFASVKGKENAELILKESTLKGEKEVVLDIVNLKNDAGPYPVLWITDSDYWIWSSSRLYRVDKKSLTSYLIGDKVFRQPYVTNEAVYFDNRGDRLFRYVGQKSQDVGSVESKQFVGWISKNGDILEVNDERGYIRTFGGNRVEVSVWPDYGDMHVKGNLGAMNLVVFILHGEYPALGDGTLMSASLRDGMNYMYNTCYMYDVNSNKFYYLPDKLGNIDIKGKRIIAYKGNFDYSQIQKILSNSH